MTLDQIKPHVLQHFTRDEVKAFGDLRKKATWQAAYDRCSEFIAAAADEASETIEEAQPVATETAEAIVTAATSEQAQAIYRKLLTAALLVVVVIGLALAKVARKLWRRFEIVRDQWLLAQASYAALVLLILKA